MTEGAGAGRRGVRGSVVALVRHVTTDDLPKIAASLTYFLTLSFAPVADRRARGARARRHVAERRRHAARSGRRHRAVLVRAVRAGHAAERAAGSLRRAHADRGPRARAVDGLELRDGLSLGGGHHHRHPRGARPGRAAWCGASPSLSPCSVSAGRGGAVVLVDPAAAWLGKLLGLGDARGPRLVDPALRLPRGRRSGLVRHPVPRRAGAATPSPAQTLTGAAVAVAVMVVGLAGLQLLPDALRRLRAGLRRARGGRAALVWAWLLNIGLLVGFEVTACSSAARRPPPRLRRRRTPGERHRLA